MAGWHNNDDIMAEFFSKIERMIAEQVSSSLDYVILSEGIFSPDSSRKPLYDSKVFQSKTLTLSIQKSYRSNTHSSRRI